MLGSLRNRGHHDSGSNLVEVALVTPFLLLIALNAINFGYYFFVAVNLAAAPRHAAEYSIQGSATPAPNASLPAPGPASTVTSVAAVLYADIQNSLPSYASASVQVCSQTVGALNNAGTATQTADCCETTSSSGTCGASSGFPSPSSDPESPNFVLNQVDVKYTVAPLIPGTVFGITLLPSFVFHQQVSMRSM